MQKIENVEYRIEYDLTAAELKHRLGIPENVNIDRIQYRAKDYRDQSEVIIQGSTPSELHVTQHELPDPRTAGNEPWSGGEDNGAL